jgi:hypothetical protein
MIRTKPLMAAIAASALMAGAGAAQAHGWHHRGRASRLFPGNLLVGRSVYSTADIQPGVTQLPPGCTTGNCVTATSDGAYPYVFDNALVDGSFGITSKVFLDQLTPWGTRIDTIPVPASNLVTSFSSKSELALNLSTDGRDVTFMGYQAPVAALDVSNSNTPLVIDPSNPVPGAYYRVVAEMNAQDKFRFTLTNAYSGNNGRAAILANAEDRFYTAGNAGNGSTPQPAGVVQGAGAQIMTPSELSESDQNPLLPTPVGNFNVSVLDNPTLDPPDKVGKDDNFRGETIFDNVLYYTKGSGGNGVNTVYFVDTTGSACTNGVGLPAANATLPTAPFPFSSTTGLPTNMCILKGFNTISEKAKNPPNLFPFGLWFASSHALYVADEGDGSNAYSTSSGTYTDAAAQTTAGLQKWVFDSTTQQWNLAYTLQKGLDLGQPYSVSGYPTGDNPAVTPPTPWAPATDGLRNITGRVNRNGTVTIYAITSTVSGSGDQGADPNKLVAITDDPSAATPGSETFHTILTAKFGQVVRGVAFTPGSGRRPQY